MVGFSVFWSAVPHLLGRDGQHVEGDASRPLVGLAQSEALRFDPTWNFTYNALGHRAQWAYSRVAHTSRRFLSGCMRLHGAAENLTQDPSNYPVQPTHAYQWDAGAGSAESRCPETLRFLISDNNHMSVINIITWIGGAEEPQSLKGRDSALPALLTSRSTRKSWL